MAGAIVWAAGCAGPSAERPPAARPPATRTPAARPSPNVNAPAAQATAPDEKRFILAPELTSVLHVVNVWLSHPPGRYLKVEVTLQNMTKSPQRFSYHIDWFNEDGGKLPVEDDGFIPWMLMANEVSSFSVTATSAAAADCGIAFVPAAQ